MVTTAPFSEVSVCGTGPALSESKRAGNGDEIVCIQRNEAMFDRRRKVNPTGRYENENKGWKGHGLIFNVVENHITNICTSMICSWRFNRVHGTFC